MMGKRKNRAIMLYFIPPLITVAVILVIYALKGQYPFGAETIMDNDWGVNNYPGLVRFWDVAHGTESVLFDWSTGLGLPKNAVSAFFYPVNYLLLIFRRDYLYEAMNFYFIAQMAAVSVTSFAFFKNVFKKLSVCYSFVYSIAFTFCGFTIQYYTNINWLSAVALFPLLALSAYKLITEKSFVFYTLMLSYSLIINTYLTFFMLEGIVLTGTLFILCFLSKEERKGAAFRLGMGTFSAFLISFWAAFGFMFSTFSSTRMGQETNNGLLAKYIELLKTENEANSYKILMLLGMEIGIASIIMIVIKHRKEIKKSLFFLFGFLLFAIPIAFDSIDMILNGGGYNGYEMRNGFLISFFLCCAAAYYMETFDNAEQKEKNKILSYAKPFLCILGLYVEIPLYIVMSHILSSRNSLNDNGNMLGLSILYNMGTAMVFGVILALLIFTLKNKKARAVFALILFLFVFGVNTYSTLGAREGQNAENSEQNKTERYILDCNRIHNDVKNDDPFERIVVPCQEFYPNYPVLLDRTSVSDWSHIVSEDFRKTFYYLGYGMINTSISNSGSTVFGNAILGVKNAVSTVDLNSDLFSSEKKLENGFSYYESKYSFPLGIVFDKDIFDVKFNGNFFDYQNEIYQKMQSGDDGLFVKIEPSAKSFEQYVASVSSRYTEEYKIDKDKYKAVFTFNVKEKSALYFCLDDGSDVSTDKIVVDDCKIELNGERFIIPNYYSKTAELYRTGNNNNLIELGTFENEEITLYLNSYHPEIENPVVYAVSLDKLDNLCKEYKPCVKEYSVGKQSFRIIAEGEKGKYLFVPVYNNGNWECTVNGVKTEVKSVLGAFTAIELQDGENEISVRYVPKVFYVTIVFSILALFVFVMVMIIVRKKQVKAPAVLQGLFLFALTGLFSAFVAIAYAIPLIAQIYYLVVGRG